MKYTQGKYLILSKKTLAKEIYDLTILCPDVAEAAVAGQFVNVKVDGFMLRRPISICSIDKNKGTLRIIFEVRGEGTKVMSQLAEGAMIDIVAPLGGRGFEMDGHETAVIIGGGIGNPPMLAVAENFGKNATVISGYRNASAVILQDDFAATGAETILCTDDGSAGRKGFVTDALKEVLASKKPDVIYACGPNVMLRRIIEIAKENGVKCQVSLEERMGCGVGACLVCACRTIRDGNEYYAHVCKDGPVFNAEEVLFDE
ncbi:MAG: dihydroorotate dehydrogenase electron transfer subunit [Oscillospiraceae bacterium]|nr:dihydroorotate dehydrogenase electron transfer subunit [Oscillospiraceae bacterium]